jgi:hypothetical protein
MDQVSLRACFFSDPRFLTGARGTRGILPRYFLSDASFLKEAKLGDPLRAMMCEQKDVTDQATQPKLIGRKIGQVCNCRQAEKRPELFQGLGSDRDRALKGNNADRKLYRTAKNRRFTRAPAI